ncbi:hypothetical protein A3B45_05325 [Candidatus Daviesbacteria bacterium RIFCSPLOWO2_01_FULL_39_12]|uniref:AI-2E family transporter n=1 Tax=Candidatus Daviesbacteria bacterium RIFCSPLOWO2_01_FULL_39_12 TaxID=1797785 RepID=A0A1F5KQD9_9BACT|nr:MAG: hypothetical protein A3B45_05325 [Candidatus Daviesbacteria bacterium RIFCSPLOWO2_01_FULL_39_12]
MSQRIDISYKTVIFITAFILGLWLLFLIRDLLLILFSSIILMSALSPLVKIFVGLKIPRPLSIAITYLIILGIVAGILASILPPLIEQTTTLLVSLPPLLTQIFNITAIDKSVISQEFANLSRNFLTFTLAAFDNLLTFIFLLVTTFYLLLEKDGLENRVAKLFVGKEERVRKSIVRIEEKLGAWLRGQVILSLLIGFLSYIGLFILNIPYALPLAVLAGLMEVIPIIGPIISAIPPILISLTISPVLALAVTATYFIIQQAENNLIVPQVMKRAVGLNPLIVILAIAVGSRLLGIAGALLAVPIAVVLQIIVTQVIEEGKL